MSSKQADNLIKYIADDLSIFETAGLDDSLYSSFVVYSALGQWVKTICYDKTSFNTEIGLYQDGNSSKNHITTRLKKILDEYIAHIPEITKWFSPDDEVINTGDVVTEIRKRIINAGILVSDRNNSLQCPINKCTMIAPEMYLYRGSISIIPDQVIGLGSFSYTKLKIQEVSLEEMFNIPTESAEVILNRYLKFIKRYSNESSVIPEQRKYFNPKVKQSLSNSWEQNYPSGCEVTLYSDTPQDFGIVTFEDDNYKTSPLPKSFIDMYETRRFCYGLRCKFGNTMNAKVKRIDDNYCSIKLPSFLPKKEQAVLYLLSWPYHSYREGPEYVTTYEVLPAIEKILNSLHIGVEK